MVIKESVWYAPAAEPRTLHIYLPDSYDASDERYPVMYFWDGHNLFYDSDATYGKSWGLREFLDSWAKDMIIVGIGLWTGSHRVSSPTLIHASARGRQERRPPSADPPWEASCPSTR